MPLGTYVSPRGPRTFFLLAYSSERDTLPYHVHTTFVCNFYVFHSQPGARRRRRRPHIEPGRTSYVINTEQPRYSFRGVRRTDAHSF
jgi:hypothetical protein